MRLNLMSEKLLCRVVAWNSVIEGWIFRQYPAPDFVFIRAGDIDRGLNQAALIGKRERHYIAVLRPGAIAIIDVRENAAVTQLCTTLLKSCLVDRRAQSKAGY